MSEAWLSIIGLGEDGLAGLCDASRLALSAADIVYGGPRHLALADLGTRGRAWPVPFDVAPVLALRGQRVSGLASGDPFWFGVGGSLSAHLPSKEWQVFPAPSAFTLAAARLGWRLEDTVCFGLHATPFASTRRALHPGQRLICLMRDSAAASEFARWLCGIAESLDRAEWQDEAGDSLREQGGGPAPRPDRPYEQRLLCGVESRREPPGQHLAG